MIYKVKINSALSFVVIVYILYLIKNFDIYAFIGGIFLISTIICFSDLYYKIENGNLIIFKIIGKKNIKIRDIEIVTDPVPVMHRLNPRSGTIAIYNKSKKRFHICPDKQVDLVKEIKKLNRKANINLKSCQV